MTIEQEDLRTIPISKDSKPDLAKMVKLVKKFVTNQLVAVFYAASRATVNAIDAVEPRFFAVSHGKRESWTCYKSGVIVSGTDIHASNGPIRRRTVYLLVWGENDQRWMTWHLDSVTSIAQGKRLIDKVLKTGIID